MNRAFSLIEVLVSLTIASMSIAALAHSASSILQARRASDRQQAATLLAERRLEELLATPPEELAARHDRETAFDAAGELAVHTVIEPGPNDSLWHVSVSVDPSLGGGVVRLHTLVYRDRRSP